MTYIYILPLPCSHGVVWQAFLFIFAIPLGPLIPVEAVLVLVFTLPGVTAPWKEDATAPDTTTEGSEPGPDLGQ